MDWNDIVNKITPYIVKIETPAGHGTGFLCLYNEERGSCGIATACHVVEYAEQWQQPIRITQPSTQRLAFLQEADRIIFPDPVRDSAVIILPVGKLELPEELIPLRPIKDLLLIGDEVAWLGFPAIGRDSDTLCFFSGNVSARQESRHAYLIDGVAINGVSGGPVLYSSPADGLQIVGAITAYIANRATGEALPGLAVAQDVSHVHDTASTIKSLDEARRKRKEQQLTQPVPEPAQATLAPAAPIPAPVIKPRAAGKQPRKPR
jgi:hypothetical protein